MKLLELVNVSAGYTAAPILQRVTVRIDAAEIVTLVGANGAGKSTLVKSISGLLRPLAGEILLEGRSVKHMHPAERLHSGIAHVPEGRQIFSGMTVLENLMLGAHAETDSDTIKTRLDRVCSMFPILGKRLNDIAGNFSGGQQQMLAIGRGLMSNPRILLLDEPSLGVAPLLVAEIFKLIKQLRDNGISILLAEQNARQALAIADRGYVLENGAIVLEGSARELLSSTEVAEKYLGVGSGMEVSAAESARMAQKLRECVW